MWVLCFLKNRQGTDQDVPNLKSEIPNLKSSGRPQSEIIEEKASDREAVWA